MSFYFVDTSALVQRYHVDPGSSKFKVAAILAQPDSSHLISRIGLVEVVSAFALKVREGQIQMTDFALYRGSHSSPHRGLQNQRRVRQPASSGTSAMYASSSSLQYIMIS